MGHHEEGGRFKALDEQTALVVERGIGRPANRRHALTMQPVLGRIKQAPRRLGIVVALEEAKEAPLLLVALDVAGIHDRRDPPHIAATPGRQERPALRPLVKGVRPEPEQFFLRHDERRHPARIVAIDSPRQLDEPLPLCTGVHRSNDDFRQGRLHVGVVPVLHRLETLPTQEFLPCSCIFRPAVRVVNADSADSIAYPEILKPRRPMV